MKAQLKSDILRKLREIKVVVTDVDGTLTDNKHIISVKAIEAIRRLERKGIKVILVSGNALPILGTLARYLGTCGYVIAENGCVIGKFFRPIYVVKSKFPQDKVTEILENLGFIPAPTNPYRYVDLAFIRTGKSAKMTVNQIRRALEERGIHNVEITDSGFAIHIAPQGVNKAFGIQKLVEIMNIPLENVLAVGDGDNDAEMLEIAGVSACPANASKKIKEIADIVLSKENGDGFYELASFLLEMQGNGD